MSRAWVAPACVVLTAALLAACSGKKADKAEGDAAAPSALITVAQVQQGAIAETLTAFGAAEPAVGGERTLATPVEAVVRQVLAGAGSRVAAGQPVAMLELSPATQLELVRTAQDAATSAATLARAQRLRATGLDSDADVETARSTAATAAEARASLVQRAGAARTLRAPITGVVSSLPVAPGDLVAAGGVVGKVASISAVRIRLGVEPADAARVRPGAVVRLSNLQGASLGLGQVTAVDPRADAQTRLAGVLVRTETPPGPGLPVRGEIELRRTDGALTVPTGAVVYEADKPGVFVIQGGQAHRREVTLGLSQGDRAAVASGLAAGDQVAVAGAASLEDGMAVRTAAPAAPGPGKSAGGSAP